MARRKRPPEEEFTAVPLPLWREVLIGIDWLALRASTVYRGIGVPSGDGSGVILVPGFLGSDQYLGDMAGWLRRIGYRTFLSGIGRNAECPDLLTVRLLDTVQRAYNETGARIHLLGHSLGGVLSRSAAVRQPQLIASVVTMAAPFRCVRAHPVIMEAASFVRGRILARQNGPEVKPGCYSGRCTCDFLSSLRNDFPPSVREVNIYTKTDGVVDWRCCISDNDASNIEVPGTHVGLVFNPQVYTHVAAILAAPARTVKEDVAKA